MRRDVLELDTAVHDAVVQLTPTLSDAEGLRLLLTGGSVIDWHKAGFASLEEVDRHLALHLIDVTRPEERRRLDNLFAQAVTYVETYLQLRVPSDLREIRDVREVFLQASDTSGFRRRQVLCCTILKLMHVLQHLEAADLRLRASITEARLLALAHRHIAMAADRMRQDGLPVHAFYGSKKTRLSVVSKLLSKREDVATRIFNKLRYRVVVREHDDLVRVLTWMVRHLFPFNQLLPGQSHNNLLHPDGVAAVRPQAMADELQPLPPAYEADANRNAFSGRTFRMINRVSDLPGRLPADALPTDRRQGDGDVVFVTVEFQVVDAATARRNERGDNAHSHYKQRQLRVVRERLTRGVYTQVARGSADDAEGGPIDEDR